MPSRKIADYLLHQIQQGKGQTYRRAIKFRKDDFKDFVHLEYDIVQYIIEQQGLMFKFIEQTLVITKRNQVFDILDVEVENNFVVRYYFDISLTFGQY
jgi:hypothetical protein